MEFTINPGYLNKVVPAGFEFVTLSIRNDSQSKVVLWDGSCVVTEVEIKVTQCTAPMQVTLRSKELKQALSLFNKVGNILVKPSETGGELTLSQGTLSKTLQTAPNLNDLVVTNTKPLLTISKSDLKPFIEYLNFRKKPHIPDSYKNLLFNDGDIVATNGTALLHHTAGHFEGYALIPYEAVKTACKLAKDSISIEVSDTHAVIYAELNDGSPIKILSPLYTGKYPDWKKILLYKPRCHTFTLTLDRLAPLVKGSSEIVISFNDSLTTLNIQTDTAIGDSLPISYKSPTETAEYALYPATIDSHLLKPFLPLAGHTMVTAYVNGHVTQLDIPGYTLVILAYQDRGE